MLRTQRPVSQEENVLASKTVTRFLFPVLALVAACGRELGQPPEGREVYLTHCASCHGVDGRGRGPVASSLRTPPTDLTTIERRYGRFDERNVAAAIDGRRVVAAHGPREMPVWGAVFEADLEGESYASRTGLLRTFELVTYLRTIQER
jgi:mono/diheme cytochrome c family protein